MTKKKKEHTQQEPQVQTAQPRSAGGGTHIPRRGQQASDPDSDEEPGADAPKAAGGGSHIKRRRPTGADETPQA